MGFLCQKTAESRTFLSRQQGTDQGFDFASSHCQHTSIAISGTTVEKSSWDDQGFVVTKEVADYLFENGVVIRRTVEQDTFPCEMACAECWITYEVMSTGSSLNGVSPARKVFENKCRESFWLAYHSADNDAIFSNQAA